MDDLIYIRDMCTRYLTECENILKEQHNVLTSSVANKVKIKRLGIELRREMIEFERKHDV